MSMWLVIFSVSCGWLSVLHVGEDRRHMEDAVPEQETTLFGRAKGNEREKNVLHLAAMPCEPCDKRCMPQCVTD